jgi:hypothetical protein
MPTLSELLLDPKYRDTIIADCVNRVEARVANAPGLKGLGLKTGLAAIKKVKPDAVPRAVTRMLPEFAAALDPIYQRFSASGERDFSRYLKQHAAEAREALMAITDAKADATSHNALRSGYRRLRGTLAEELEAMLPELVKGLSARLDAARSG